MAGIFDKASEVFDKSAAFASDIFDKSKDAANDIAGQAGDIATRGKIKAKLVDQGLEYDRLMRRLGTALYDQLKDDPNYADTNQSLFAEIAACVERKQQLEDELAAAEAAYDTSRPVDVTPIESVESEATDEQVEDEPASEEQEESEEK